MTPVLLSLLAITDAAFAGFRASAGRNARIFKRDYYARNLLRGALWGIALVALLGALTWLSIALSTNAAHHYAELLTAGQRMLWVFIPYAGLVLTALVVYAVSDYDLRALATVAILGPFTLIRPWVIALGAVVGLWTTNDPLTWALTLVSSGSFVVLAGVLDQRGRLWLTVPPTGDR